MRYTVGRLLCAAPKAAERSIEMESEYKVGEDRIVPREYENGNHVVFVDPHGIRRDAIVTAWHTSGQLRAEWMRVRQANKESWAKQDPPVTVPLDEPPCNLVWVTSDEKRTDSYGQQTVRESSVVHKGNQYAHGNYWM